VNSSKIIVSVLVCIFTIVSQGLSQSDWVKKVVREARHAPHPHQKAKAIVLHDVTEVEITDTGKAKTRTKIAYKILTSDGEYFGIKSVRVYPFVQIKSLKGWVVKEDNSSKSLSKENIITMSTEESTGYYDDSHIVIAGLPDVQAGVIVAFELSCEEEGWTSFHQSFVFQKQQPVKFAQFCITIPKNWQLIKAGWRTHEVDFQYGRQKICPTNLMSR